MAKNLEALVQTVLTCGAAGAAVLDGAQVVLNEEFRRICEGNGCGNFGKCYMCPPDIGDIHTLMKQVRRYDRALLYQSIASLEDSFDFEGMMQAGHTHAMLSQRVEKALEPLLGAEHLHLSSGGCHLCQVCAKREKLPCRHPKQALGSLEGYGVDVYNTTLATPLRYINGQNTVTYFGLVLFSEVAYG